VSTYKQILLLEYKLPGMLIQIKYTNLTSKLVNLKLIILCQRQYRFRIRSLNQLSYIYCCCSSKGNSTVFNL